jgi:hypothetical protein
MLGRHTGTSERNLNVGQAYWHICKEFECWAGILADLKGI